MIPKKIIRPFRKPKYLKIQNNAHPLGKKAIQVICQSEQYNRLRGELGKLVKKKIIKTDMAESILSKFVLETFDLLPDDEGVIRKILQNTSTGRKIDDFCYLALSGLSITDTRTSTTVTVNSSLGNLKIIVQEGKK